MNGNSTRKVRVETGGNGVVAHVGLHAVGAFADQIGLGDALSSAVLYRCFADERGVTVEVEGPGCGAGASPESVVPTPIESGEPLQCWMLRAHASCWSVYRR